MGITELLKKNAHYQNEQTIECYVFHQLTGIADALRKNAHDQNEQAIRMLCMSPTHMDYGCIEEECT